MKTPSHKKPSPSRGDYTEFKKLIDSYFSACDSMDMGDEMAFYADDKGLVFYDFLPPVKYNGWHEYKEAMAKGNELHKLAGLTLKPNDDLRVIRKGSMAFTTMTFGLAYRNPKTQKPKKTVARHTIIWEKRGRRWLILHEHVSVPYSLS